LWRRIQNPPPEPHPTQQPVFSKELVIERSEQVQNNEGRQEQRKRAERHKGKPTFVFMAVPPLPAPA
jgi:hypothetical protein